MGKLIGITKSKYRVAVSDILPYERPIFFTNRFFVRFLKNYGVICRNGRLVATKKHCEGLDEILSVLGGSKDTSRPAFQYFIAKSSTERGRLLSLIHPYHQVAMVEFYDQYKSVITDFCQRSRYSIRFPYKVAVVQEKPKVYPKFLSDDVKESKPKESIKHFFAYKYYNNINDFYDDYRFLRAEKKFALMEKTDLEHCFDSIKPETLSEAMFGCTMADAYGTMPYFFYSLNQSYENKPENGEPGDGIIIGPEFSRIFAEIILQKVDVECESLLENEGILLNKDYVFYRYVDDGFLFCNNELVKNRFNEKYETCLLKYGLKRGDKKSEKHQEFDKRPFLENLTAGKLALSQLIHEKFENRLETFKGFKKIQAEQYDTPTVLNYKTFVQSVRAIMQTYGLKYKEVMSFILGVMNKRLTILLGDFNNLYKQYSQAEYLDEISEQGLHIKQQYEKDFTDFINNLAEVLFYFFSCDSRMSTSTKVISIINHLQLFVRGKYQFSNGDWSAKFSQGLIDAFDERLTDCTQNLFASLGTEHVCYIETLNFLEPQKCMSTAVQIHPRRLLALVETIGENLNFFSVFQLLHFIRNDVRYSRLKERLMEWAVVKIAPLTNQSGTSDTESVVTFFELLCCPWLDKKNKENLLEGFSQFDRKEKESILCFAKSQRDFFVKWRDYSILEEMQHISNTEVY